MKYLQRLSNELKQYGLINDGYHIREPPIITNISSHMETYKTYYIYFDYLIDIFTMDRNLKLLINILLKITKNEEGLCFVYNCIMEKFVRAGNIKYLKLFGRLGFRRSWYMINEASKGYLECLKLFHSWGMNLNDAMKYAVIRYPKSMKLLHKLGATIDSNVLSSAAHSTNPKCLRLLYNWKIPFTIDELKYAREYIYTSFLRPKNIRLLDKWIMERQNEQK